MYSCARISPARTWVLKGQLDAAQSVKSRGVDPGLVEEKPRAPVQFLSSEGQRRDRDRTGAKVRVEFRRRLWDRGACCCRNVACRWFHMVQRQSAMGSQTRAAVRRAPT